MIRLQNITKSYPARMGRKTVLKSITADFLPGRNTAIMGSNGAGKSTLMRLISGAEVPDTGRIERTSTISWPLGFKGGLHGSLTGRENLAFIARIYGRSYRDLLDFVEDFAEIGSYMQQPVAHIFERHEGAPVLRRFDGDPVRLLSDRRGDRRRRLVFQA